MMVQLENGKCILEDTFHLKGLRLAFLFVSEMPGIILVALNLHTIPLKTGSNFPAISNKKIF